MNQEHSTIEDKIWVAAYLRGLTQMPPDAARQLALQAVEIFRDWTVHHATILASNTQVSVADEIDYVPGEVLSAESYFYEDMLRERSQS